MTRAPSDQPTRNARHMEQGNQMCNLQEHSARDAREREARKDTPIYEATCQHAGFRPDAN